MLAKSLASLLIFVSFPALSADLTLICNVNRSYPNGSQSSFQKRFEFTWDTRYVTIYYTSGGKWNIQDQGNFVRADNSYIIISNYSNGSPNSYINRENGEYNYKDDSGFVDRGICERSKLGPKKF